MKKRQKLSKSLSKKTFSRGALNIHPKNGAPRPMRGGIRL